MAVEPDTEEVAAAVADFDAQAGRPVRLVLADGRALSLPAECFDLALFTWSLC